MKITVVGLGYVGLPLALELQKHFEVVGVDKSEYRLETLRKNIDYNGEHSEDEFLDCKIQYTNTVNNDSNVYIVTVPTPVDQKYTPDLSYVENAALEIGRVAPENAIVCLESTVAPGTTTGFFRNALLSTSKHRNIRVGYSPERINPGDKVNVLSSTVKIVGSDDNVALYVLKAIYSKVSKEVHMVNSCEVAECAKIFENTQRDVNIALMNEFARIAEFHGISIFDVAGAMDTKWNALKFKPGLVGGHCISVDPYYLIKQAEENNIQLSIINNSRNLNESLPSKYARKIVSIFNAKNSSKVLNANVLIVGAAFKPGVNDVRNSKAIDLAKEISGLRCQVSIYDPLVNRGVFEKEYHHLTGTTIPNHIKLENSIDVIRENLYDIIITFSATQKDSIFYTSLMKQNGIIYDLQGIISGLRDKRFYYSP